METLIKAYQSTYRFINLLQHKLFCAHKLFLSLKLFFPLKLFLTLLLSVTLLNHTAAAKLVTVIDSPNLLTSLESEFPIGKWLGQGDEVNNQQLTRQAYYRSIMNSIASDLDAARKKDPQLSVSMAKSHRLLDKQWLFSKQANFELIGIINRLDRQPFATETCGEIRLIYRLAYRATQDNNSAIESRLPLTVNTVFWVPDDGMQCQQAARRWDMKEPLNATQLLADDGPLHRSQLSFSQLKSIEINLQAIRWPSTVRPDMGGYAEYFLRVFTFNSSRELFQLAPLENTPDTKLLQYNPEKKAQLLNWLKQPEQLQQLDQGLLQLPVQYLAKKASSFALHGLARKANRPYDQIFSEENFAEINFTNYTSIQSPYALLRRLNDMSCVGCHQARTIAGFHFVGKDRPDTSSVNSIHVARSPHLSGDLQRRVDYLKALVNGSSAKLSRPFSERAVYDEGELGSHCTLGIDTSFKKWSCKQGLQCQQVSDQKNSPIGRCVSKQPQAGSACEIGIMTQHNNPLKDRIVQSQLSTCGTNNHCERTRVGFPNGMCSSNCDHLADGETCGSIAVLYGFNRCLAANKPFTDCLEQNVRPASLMQCDNNKSCNDDYICARTASGQGACIPPYFLFQLRVDGHPRP
ncbi:MAG: hypothetical protein ACRBHB_06240 [Arenicella sp.]